MEYHDIVTENDATNMKYIKLLTLAALLSISFLMLTTPAHGAALSKAEQTNCFKNWDGKASPINSYPKGYLAGNCDSAKGGNCSKDTSVESGKSSAVITCVKPSTTSSTTTGSIPQTEDPALQYKACRDPDNCNLVKQYVNPLINKFLAPLAILAVIIGIIWGSLEFTTSGGDPQRVAAGKGRIQKALVGLLAFMFLYALLNWLLPGGLITK